MRTDLLTNTKFGKYYPTQINSELKTIQLDNIKDIQQCRFTIHH